MVRLFLMAAVGISAIFAADAPTPKIDKGKLEAYLRYIEGYTSGVKLAIDDPLPSAYSGYWRIVVHLTLEGKKVGDRIYYVGAGGERFLSGTMWDLNENPFLDTLDHLPTDGPSFGPADARVTIVVFSDFQCPYCRQFAKTTREQLPHKYPNDVRLIFKDFPLENIHPWAKAAAEAGDCVADQNQTAFWAFHDWIFEHQQEVNATNLTEKTMALAKEQHLDPEKLSSCLSNHAKAPQVEESQSEGRRLQVQQTPTAFVNGRIIAGAVPWSTLDSVIQFELNRPKEIPGPGTPKCCEITAPTVLKK